MHPLLFDDWTWYFVGAAFVVEADAHPYSGVGRIVECYCK